ncbi:MAG: NAD(P)-binding domain-containing protein [Gemmatimonadota bacterium]
MDPVCIVGAGPAGLAAGAALRARGLPFRIVDAGPGPGGIWDVDRRETPMYRSAHFISSRSLSGFPGFPMPEEYPDYPRHDLVFRYIRAFARHHRLEEHATFATRVTEAAPLPGGGWKIRLVPASEGGGEGDTETLSASALVLATGANWHPNLPEIPGVFQGDVRHSFHYRSADDLRGRRVLVVGAGNSGVDIACDAARVAEAAYLSVRRGYRFVPKYVFGVPADAFAHSGPSLPAWMERRLFAFLPDRILVGDVTRYGLPRPDHAALASHPIMNTRVLDHMGHGDLQARPDVERFDGDAVVFRDGRREDLDLVILATGYRRPFPFLRHPDLDAQEEMPAEVLYLNLLHRTTPDLFLMGLFETDGAAYGLFGEQAEVVARAVETVLGGGPPAERLARLRTRDRPDLRGGRDYVPSRRHRYYVTDRAYRRSLRRLRSAMGWT